jgi:hypothetical protein
MNSKAGFHGEKYEPCRGETNEKRRGNIESFIAGQRLAKHGACVTRPSDKTIVACDGGRNA